MEFTDTDYSYKVTQRVMFFDDPRTSVDTFDGNTCDICGAKTPYTKISRYVDDPCGEVIENTICKIQLCPICLESLADVIRSRINKGRSFDDVTSSKINKGKSLDDVIRSKMSGGKKLETPELKQ